MSEGNGHRGATTAATTTFFDDPIPPLPPAPAPDAVHGTHEAFVQQRLVEIHDRQRRRINAGHLLSARQGYRPSTSSMTMILRALVSDRPGRRRPHWLLAVAALEVAAKLAARVDVARGDPHTVWRVAESTKRPIEQESA